jgi:imidazolonepropionase-like amidohydrolase
LLLEIGRQSLARVVGNYRGSATVERGTFADSALLDANPMKDINNTRKVRSVVVDGQYLSRDDPDRILPTVQAPA